jgi:hypothetical protein
MIPVRACYLSDKIRWHELWACNVLAQRFGLDTDVPCLKVAFCAKSAPATHWDSPCTFTGSDSHSKQIRPLHTHSCHAQSLTVGYPHIEMDGSAADISVFTMTVGLQNFSAGVNILQTHAGAKGCEM